MSSTIKRTIVGIGAAIAVAAIGIAVAAGLAAGDEDDITVLERAGDGYEEWYDIGAEDNGPGADGGDTLFEHKPLVDPDTEEPVGTAITRVQVVDVSGGDPTFIIDCTVRLDDGDLVFYGAGSFGDLGDGVTFAVTGGTGAYDRAAGIVTVTVGDEGAVIAFELED